MTLPFVSLLAFLCACQGDCPDGFLRDNDGNCLEVDTDSDADSDADTDSDTDSDAEKCGDGACDAAETPTTCADDCCYEGMSADDLSSVDAVTCVCERWDQCELLAETVPACIERRMYYGYPSGVRDCTECVWSNTCDEGLYHLGCDYLCGG